MFHRDLRLQPAHSFCVCVALTLTAEPPVLADDSTLHSLSCRCQRFPQPNCTNQEWKQKGGYNNEALF